jgi:diguanylate cyclase
MAPPRREPARSAPPRRGLIVRVFDWLTHRPAGTATSIHDELLRTQLSDGFGLTAMTASWAIGLPALGAVFTGSPRWWPLALLMALLSGLVVGLQRSHLAAVRARHRVTGRGLLFARLLWYLGLGSIVSATLADGELRLAMMSTAVVVAFDGVVCARFAAFPRFAVLLLALMFTAHATGLLHSPNRDFAHLVWLLVPGALAFLALLSLQHRVLMTAVNAQHENLRLSRHDVLTGLPNRLLLQEELAALCRYALPAREHFAVLALDLDGFKSINDVHGHAAGDWLLREVAERLRRSVRAPDLAARLGGDEFVVLVPASGVREGTEVAERVLAALHEPLQLPDGTTVRPGASIGLAVAPASGATPDALLGAADDALYQAKRAGKGRWALHGSNTAETLVRVG